MANTIAKAYVQVIPSAEGIKNKLKSQTSGDLKSFGESAGSETGQSLGMALVSKCKKLILAAGLGEIIKQSVSAGADLEQSMGGIETLFGDSANTMKQYATQAYQTAGLSANEYMEQATSFSASLLQSLGGDTAKATEATNQALIDMADNSNKMGTSIENIQNAYQGFAKQNYTMLDNLNTMGALAI